MHALNGPRLKVQRAIEHLEALKKRRDAFGKDNPTEYATQRRMNRATGLGEFILVMKTVLPDPPKEWGVIVGEIAHQLLLGVSGFGQFWVREIGVKKLLV